MKKSWIILVGFLFLIAQPLTCLAGIETVPAKSVLQNDPIRNTATKEGQSPNLNKKERNSGKQGKGLAGIHRHRTPQTQGPKAGRNAGSPVSSPKMTPLKGYVVLVQGDAKAQLGGKGDWVGLRAGDAVPPQSNLKTGRDGVLEIKYEDGSSLLLRSETEVTIIEAWKTRTSRLLRDFFLSAGRVIAKVQSATGQSPRFRVHTPSAIASVRGTEFRVAVDKKQKTFVEVLESKVTVDTATKVINLAKGEGAMIKNTTPPSPPRKLLLAPNPVGLLPFHNAAPAIVLAPVSGAHAYRVMVAKDEPGKQLVWESVIKPGERFTLTGLTDGVYYLLTQSIDPIGLEGTPSEPYPFTIRENPMPPMILMPGAAPIVKGKTATLEWLSVGDAVRYHLQISEDREFQKLLLDKADLTGVTFKADGLENKPYTFRIRSIAKDGYAGAWSDPVSFTLSPLPPTAPESSPGISTDEITLRSRSVSEGVTYHVQVAKDDQFKEVLVAQKVNKPVISIKKPQEDGLCFVRIAVIDRNGKACEFSQPQSFTIQQRLPYVWLGAGGGAFLLFLLLAL